MRKKTFNQEIMLSELGDEFYRVSIRRKKAAARFLDLEFMGS